MSLHRFLSALAVVLLASCGNVHLGMRDISRPPAVAAIVLDQSIHSPPNKKVHEEFFPGVYKPIGQDSDGTYYQSSRLPRLHDITEWLSKDFFGGLYLRDDMSTGLEQWARNGELVGHGPISKDPRQNPPYRVIKAGELVP